MYSYIQVKSGILYILFVNVYVIYLCCCNFVGVFEPFFFQGGVSIMFVSMNIFLFQFCLQFEYQKPIVDLN